MTGELTRFQFIVYRMVSKPGFLWHQINHGRHNIFWLFRSKALQKVKKITNPCRFRVSNLLSKFLRKSLSKMTIFISKMKWHFRISFFFKIFTFKLIFFPSKSSFTKKMWPFEVHHVDIAQKMMELKGASWALIVAFETPYNCLNFWATSIQ